MPRRQSCLILVALSFVLRADCCGVLRLKPPDPNYVPTVMSPGPDHPLTIAVDRDHNNLHKLGGCVATFKHFGSFFRAQGHLVEERIPGTTYAIEDPDTHLPVPAGVLVVPVAVLSFTTPEIDDLLDFVAAGGGALVITDHGSALPLAVQPLFASFDIQVNNTSVVCGNPTLCPLAPNPGIPIPLAQPVPSVYTYHGASFAPPASGDASCVFSFLSDAYDLIAEGSAEGDCQSVATTHGCGKLYAAGSIEMFTAFLNLGTEPQGFGDPNNPHGEEWVYDVMEWLGTPLAPGEGTCPPAP